MNFKTINLLVIIYLVNISTVQLKAQTCDNISSLNRYSFDLYHEAKVDKKNLFLSPLSTYYALLLGYEGSKHKTKQEFEKVFSLKCFSFLKSEYLNNLVSKSDSCLDFKISNAIWLDKSLQVEEEYRKSVVDKYFSDFKVTNFANAGSAASDINGWYSEKANRRINEVINTTNINPDTKLLISNTVYFKGEWLNKFEKKKTISAPFFTSVENQYTIDFMKMTESLQYFENDEYQFISKPYRDSDISLCIVLPKELFGIGEIEKKVDNNFLKRILDSAYYTKTALSIPKIKLESSYELSDALKKAGLKIAFTSDADFSGITKETPLMLDKVVHKTWIEFDEEKTEAAAATATVIRITGLPSYKIFKADHPFVFFIIDNTTRAILFMGRYIEPTLGGKIVEDKESLTNNLEIRKKEKFAAGNAHKKILYVVDKKIMSQTEFDKITKNPEDIESINLIKSKEEISKYSSEDYDGALIIALKKNKK